MTDLAFSVADDGRCVVTGRLGFDTVHTIWDISRAALAAAQRVEIDLGGVTHVDSAGLALVLAWAAVARARGVAFAMVRAPAKLLDLARISEVEALLSPPAAG